MTEDYLRQFVIIFSFKVPREKIKTELINKHFAHLKGGYDFGHILMYGKRPFETGTLAIIRTDHAHDIGTILSSDPLIREGFATYDFFEFMPEIYPIALEGWVNPIGFEGKDPDLIMRTQKTQ